MNTANSYYNGMRRSAYPHNLRHGVRVVHRFTELILAAVILFPSAGCLDDEFLDTMKRENVYYSFSVSESNLTLSVYFPISDSGQVFSYRTGDDGSFINMPDAISLQVMDNYSGADDVVRDNTTGLTWTKCSARNVMDTDDNCAGPAQTYVWQDAYDFCNGLNYAGSTDWRLPTMPELFSISDFGQNQLIDTSVFLSNAASKYWTSTVVTGYYYYLDYNDPHSFANVESPTVDNYLRCVRGPD